MIQFINLVNELIPIFKYFPIFKRTAIVISYYIILLNLSS